MENAAKALLIAGSVLLGILIIAIGMFVYNSAQSTVVTSMYSMKTSEIESYNNNYEHYKGKQKGRQISSLIGKVIAMASVYKEEKAKQPVVMLEGKSKYAEDVIIANNKDFEEYISQLGKMKNSVKDIHEYNTVFDYDPATGLIISIIIEY